MLATVVRRGRRETEIELFAVQGIDIAHGSAECIPRPGILQLRISRERRPGRNPKLRQRGIEIPQLQG